MALSGELFKQALDTLSNGIYFVDEEQRIIFWNKAAELLTGFGFSEVKGRHCSEIFSHCSDQGGKLCNATCPVQQALGSKQPHVCDVSFHHKEGRRLPVTLRLTPVKNGSESYTVAVEISRDRTGKAEMRQQLEELTKVAMYDPLTGLPTRRQVELNLRSRLEEMQRYGGQFGVLLFEIDNFDTLCEAYGPVIADKVLKMAPKQIGRSLRSFDILGRWNGKEFAALVMNVNEEQLFSVAERCRLLVEQSAVTVGKDRLPVTVSVGATLVQKNDTDRMIVLRAEQLLRISKGLGGNRTSLKSCL